ncbi:MAG: SGNH/GDSL hydrolase family protein [Thermoguttaceae bacterium]
MTYQWYRSTTAGFTPGSGNLLTGQTSLSFTDSGLTPGTTYYYACVATDSSRATATSTASGTTAASGGALTAGTASFTSATTSQIAIGCTGPTGGSGSYQYQWQRAPDAATWTSISGATSLTLTDAPTAQSLPYAYRLKVYDGTSTVYSNVVWGALEAPMFTIGWIGDSLWGALNGGNTTGSNLANELVPSVAQANLEAIHGPRNIVSANAAVSGTHTADWLPTASNGTSFGLSPANCWDYALATFAAAGPTSSGANQYIMIMLGTNDAAEEISQATYQSNLATICATILAAFPTTKIILNYPAATFAGFDQYLPPYWTAINNLVNGATILQGDTEFPAFCADNRSQFSELQVHPNIFGQYALGQLHAQAVSKIIDGAGSSGGYPSLAEIATAIWSDSTDTVDGVPINKFLKLLLSGVAGTTSVNASANTIQLLGQSGSALATLTYVPGTAGLITTSAIN